ncbi:uncharacterized protein PSFLO_05187 [Pseudozyma flocculosa]|uniref:Uncharacterized protein n=1 Tax=Pseudozyma flocculosa TaxID=84751 RepID=A0A5C3F6P8_9BASI|nr:uncharacterized protein PSFLO_05187 [Pseudozyma flocculosa]
MTFVNRSAVGPAHSTLSRSKGAFRNLPEVALAQPNPARPFRWHITSLSRTLASRLATSRAHPHSTRTAPQPVKPTPYAIGLLWRNRTHPRRSCGRQRASGELGRAGCLIAIGGLEIALIRPERPCVVTVVVGVTVFDALAFGFAVSPAHEGS